MKIAVVNKFFFSRGGQESLMFEEAKMLEQAEHEVAFFSMHHPENPKEYKYAKYFVDYIELSALGNKYNILDKLKIAKDFIYNKKAASNFDLFLNDFKPDIIHCHGIAHQLTYSILPVAKKYNIPVVQTLHDYQLICPCYTLLKGADKVCDIDNCSNRFYAECIKNKCVKKSLSASVLSAVEMIFSHKIINSSKYVDKFLCPSSFLRENMIKNGFAKEKFLLVPNFTNNIENFVPEFTNQGYFLYFGRLSYEKGLFTLLKTFKELNNVKLIIVGSGPLSAELASFKEEANINNVEFVGFQSGENLVNYIKNAIAVILPAEWHENAPMSIIEAFAYGKPVIASKLGGSPEMIKDDFSGYLFKHGDVEDLKSKISNFLNNRELSVQLGQNARDFALKNYTNQIHLEKLITIYKELVNVF